LGISIYSHICSILAQKLHYWSN